jgi:methionyl aminopeptidase
MNEASLMTEKFSIPLHGPEGFEGMRRAGHLAASCLDMLAPMVKPGVTTEALDNAARSFVLDHGGVPACLFYRGYQHTICTSINHVVCHGIPGDKALRDGDIVNIDVTVIVNGWHGDTSRMYPVGQLRRKSERIIHAAFRSMWAGIEMVRPGNSFGDIGAAMERVANEERLGNVEDFCGHGLGRVFHAPPNVVQFGKPGAGPILKPGMFFTIEPMLNLGRADTKVLGDGWTAVTRDKSLSAQFEHSVGVTDTGYEVFTLSPAGLDRPGFG